MARLVLSSWPHDLPALSSRVAGITGVSHHSWFLLSNTNGFYSNFQYLVLNFSLRSQQNRLCCPHLYQHSGQDHLISKKIQALTSPVVFLWALNRVTLNVHSQQPILFLGYSSNSFSLYPLPSSKATSTASDIAYGNSPPSWYQFPEFIFCCYHRIS